MPLITRRTDRVMLHDQDHPFSERTGGWYVTPGDLTYVFATDFLRDSDITSQNKPYLVPQLTTLDGSLFCPKLGSLVVLAENEMSDFSWHRMSYRTMKAVDFVNSKYLKFTFNRMNSEKVANACLREVIITIEDEDGNVLRTWDGSGKSCWSEHGRIDVMGLKEGYICIPVGLRLSSDFDTDKGRLLTMYGDPFLTSNGEYFIVDPMADFTNDTGAFGVTASAYIDISDMWLESDINPLLYTQHQM